ncbi:MAG: DUF721 domain-containing protein [Propionivibrio sp.]|uniref:DUF721 domain-containing protein n=1 Tax=Candidatus Propionivibrio dominans TaxID=2954373 RepID=A0A9D7FDX3_9RHOO|nr:DUF721 domain-containing protein [Candidatus Propionivibrio dominans]
MQNSLENYLEAADGAGKVMAHARLLIKLTHLYQEIAPTHLGQASRLANYKSGIIVIHAVSGAVAAKLRQMAPTLAEGFSKRGVECNGVQVKVQARKISTQSRASTQKPLSSRTSRTLEGLRDSLPDSPLRAALETLLTHSAKQE